MYKRKFYIYICYFKEKFTFYFVYFFFLSFFLFFLFRIKIKKRKKMVGKMLLFGKKKWGVSGYLYIGKILLLIFSVNIYFVKLFSLLSRKKKFKFNFSLYYRFF